MVGAGREELRSEEAAGAVQLDPVEARLVGELGAPPVVLDDPEDLVGVERSGHDTRLDHVAVGVGEQLPVRRDGRWRDRLGVGSLVVGHRHPTDVHHLHHDRTALGVHRVGHPLPSDDLLGVDQSRGSAVALAVLGRIDALGHDQPGTGPLAVVLDHEVGDLAVGPGPGAGQRRHHHPVLQIDRAEPCGGQQGLERHDRNLARPAGAARSIRRGPRRWR